MMSEDDFKRGVAKLDDAFDISILCLKWLREEADEQAPKVRLMMRAAIDVIQRGIE